MFSIFRSFDDPYCVDKCGTLVWFLSLHDVFHHCSVNVLAKLQELLPLDRECVDIGWIKITITVLYITAAHWSLSFRLRLQHKYN